MPPCAPQSTYQRNNNHNNNKHSSGTRRVIFPTLYEDAASHQHSPELMEAVSVRLDTKVEVPSLACTTGFTLTNDYQPHPPSSPQMEIPEGATPPRLACNRRSILGRYQPLPINPQFPVPKKPAQLVSILRATSFGGTGITNNSTCPKKDGSSQSLGGPIRTGSQKAMRRSSSEPGRTKNHIQFDPRIWIREFERSPEEHDCTWYNEDDLERFKRHAMALIMACKDRLAPQILPTGTGRTMTTRRAGKGAAFYTHSALAMEMEDHSLTKAMHDEQYRAMVAQQEIQRILIVDPHDICITLFSKAFRTLLPHAQIVTASSASDALEQIASQAFSPSFDILVVEERLQTPLQQRQHQQSGSDLLKTLRQLQPPEEQQHMTLSHSSSLWIGVSAHPKDRTTLEKSGADMCWGKPPPKMSVELRNQLLQALLLKRGKSEFSRELFG